MRTNELSKEYLNKATLIGTALKEGRITIEEYVKYFNEIASDEGKQTWTELKDRLLVKPRYI
jgi:hypothetical protein